MTSFSDLSKAQQEELMKKLEEKLIDQPNEDQKLWYNFASKNLGFEFMHKGTGKKLSKLEFFTENKKTPQKLNLASENLLDDWRRVLKPGWTMINFGEDNTPSARRTEDIPTYKKHK